MQTPPQYFLGRFIEAGQSDMIIRWMQDEIQNTKPYDAVIISTDMLAYGGLVESRWPTVSETLAKARLYSLKKIKQNNKTTKVFAFATLMRIAPTSTDANEDWIRVLIRYTQMQEQYRKTGYSHYWYRMDELKDRVPEDVLNAYFSARKRNFAVIKYLIDMVARGEIDELIIGTDDAQEVSPQAREKVELRSYAREKKVLDRVFFCEGADQLANLQISKYVIELYGYTPKVNYRVSNPSALFQVAAYESIPLKDSIEAQIIASGGEVTYDSKQADYTLYVYTPGTEKKLYDAFVYLLLNDLRQNRPVAIADINFRERSDAHKHLFTDIMEHKYIDRLYGYAAWNTASNTIGTSIPHGNLFVIAKKNGLSIESQKAHFEFLLHRILNDVLYHDVVRPGAYAIIDNHQNANRNHVRGTAFDSLQEWVSQETAKKLNVLFENYFRGMEIKSENGKFKVSGLKDVSVSLPWPRAFESKVEFELVIQRED